MLNTDMGMVFDQNIPMATCMKEAKANNPGMKGRGAYKKARAECNKKFTGPRARGLPGVLA